MHWIVNVDTSILKFFNLELVHPFLDRFIPLFSHFDKWKIPLIVLLIVIVVLRRKEGVLIVVGLGLTILLSEAMSTTVLKELIDRVRPCHINDWVRLIEGYCPKSPALPSSHATNISAAITFLAFFFPRWLFVMIPLAVLVGYSRVYLGVHYPLDVVGGWILGVLCGWSLFAVFKTIVFPRLARFGITVKHAPATLKEKKPLPKKRKTS